MVRHDFQAILMYQQNAGAGWMRSVDFPLAFNDALVALGENFGSQVKSIGITRVWMTARRKRMPARLMRL